MDGESFTGRLIELKKKKGSVTGLLRQEYYSVVIYVLLSKVLISGVLGLGFCDFHDCSIIISIQSDLVQPGS